MLNRLLDLAREGGDKRRELFHAVSDLFVDGVERYNDREIILFGEVLGQLLDQTQVDDRISMSRRVAFLNRTPRELALKLADDEHPVAAPILQFSEVLTDQDLVSITERKGDDHRIAIARRARLGEVVTDALVDHGGAAVIETVTLNRGARFSGRSRAVLAERAFTNERLAEAMSRRSDLPMTMAEGVVKIISPAARKGLGTLIRDGDAHVGGVVTDASTTMEAARLDSRRQRAEATIFIAEVQDGRRPIDEVLAVLLGQKRVMDIIYVLAELADVPEAHVSNAFHKISATAIAVVCRHLEVSAAVYGELTRLRCERLCLDSVQADQMLREYRDMTPGTADRALKFHQQRSSSRQLRR